MASLLLLSACDGLDRTATKDEPQSTTEEGQTSERDKKLLEDLNAAGEKLVQIIKDADTEGFIRLCDSDGIGLEPDIELTIDDIRNQMRQKKGLYCLLFDTECLQEESGNDSYKSYRDLFRSAHNLKISASLSYEFPEGRLGGVGVKWEGDPDPSEVTSGKQFPAFMFIYRNSTWKLNEIIRF
ncbi:MAG: hypothetical protein ACE5HC_15905 [Candidatus Binatia bacterium]